jgi:hypothetical protein
MVIMTITKTAIQILVVGMFEKKSEGDKLKIGFSLIGYNYSIARLQSSRFSDCDYARTTIYVVPKFHFIIYVPHTI